MSELIRPVELSDAELDSVAGGVRNEDNFIAADVIVNDVRVVVRDINVNVNALNGGPIVNANL
jgi:hypothetical protein